MSETWVIKDNAPVGEDSAVLNKIDISFTSGGKEFIGIGINEGDESYVGFNLLTYYSSNGTVVQPAYFEYSTGGMSQFSWEDPAYKTLIFDTAPTGELLAWLKKNADMQDKTYLTTESELKSIADAIRAKGGTTDPLVYAGGFVTAIEALSTGDMLKATYDPTGSVEAAGGIPDYVEANGGKIDTIKVNGTAQPIVNKEVDISVPTNNTQLTNGAGYITASDVPVKSVNSKTGDVVLSATDVGALPTSGGTLTGNLKVGSANIQTNGYVVGTWLQSTSQNHLTNAATKIAVQDGSGWIYHRTAKEIKSDIGLSNVDNVKQYSANNPPPYPVTSVNGKTGAVTISVPTVPSTTSLLKGNGSGGLVAATRGSDYIASGNIVKQTLVATETTPTENYTINWVYG